ncbi:hypothetical protein ACV3P8_16910, partial [Clostridium perfringens]
DGTEDTVNVTVDITETQATKPNPPSAIAQKDGSVTITPAGDEATKISVTFKDNDDTNIPIIAVKDKQGKWRLQNEFPGVVLNEDLGIITIEESAIKDGTTVIAYAINSQGIRSEESEAIAISKPVGPVDPVQTDAQKYDPTVSAGSVSVNKDNVKTPEQKETLKTDILNKVTVPAEAGNVTKEVQGDLPTTLGSHQVPVKVTYADGTED